MKAVIDTREPQPVIEQLNEIFSYYGYGVEIKALDFGDIMTENAIVERKTINDLYSSTVSKRLERQLNGILEICENNNKVPILAVHGSIYKLATRKGNPFEVVFGAMSSAVTRYGVHVVYMDSTRDLFYTVAKICYKLDKGVYMMPKKTKDDVLLSRLLGIPLKTTKNLLKEFGTIQNIANAEVKDLVKVKGIGKTTAGKIVNKMRGGMK